MAKLRPLSSSRRYARSFSAETGAVHKGKRPPESGLRLDPRELINNHAGLAAFTEPKGKNCIANLSREKLFAQLTTRKPNNGR